MTTFHLTANDCRQLARIAVAVDKAEAPVLRHVHVAGGIAEATDGKIALWSELESELDGIDALLPPDAIKALAKSKSGATITADAQLLSITAGPVMTQYEQPEACFPAMRDIIDAMALEEAPTSCVGFTAVNLARLAKAWPKAHIVFEHKNRGSLVRAASNLDSLRGLVMHIPLPK